MTTAGENLDLAGGAKYVTVMGFLRAYIMVLWQISIDDKDFEKTSFVTHKAKHFSKCAPIGIMNATSVVVYTMSRDIFALSKSREGILVHDTSMMSSLVTPHVARICFIVGESTRMPHRRGLDAQPSKLEFGPSHVTSLGYICILR